MPLPNAEVRRSLRWRSPGVLRDEGFTTALIGASRPSQVEDCAAAVKNLEFTPAELAEIDTYAEEEDINLWVQSSKTAET